MDRGLVRLLLRRPNAEVLAVLSVVVMVELSVASSVHAEIEIGLKLDLKRYSRHWVSTRTSIYSRRCIQVSY